MDERGQIGIVGWLLSGWLLFSTALAVGTVPGGWLLEATGGSASDNEGWVYFVWLPFGTMIDIDGIKFKVCADGDPPYGIFLYQPEYKEVDRGKMVLIGRGIEVHIKDYFFLGRPTISGMYLANIKISKPALNLTRPLMFLNPLQLVKVENNPEELDIELVEFTGSAGGLVQGAVYTQVSFIGNIKHGGKRVGFKMFFSVDNTWKLGWDSGTKYMDENDNSWIDISGYRGNKFRFAPTVFGLYPRVRLEIWSRTLEGIDSNLLFYAEIDIKDVTQNLSTIFDNFTRLLWGDLENQLGEITSSIQTWTETSITQTMNTFNERVIQPLKNQITVVKEGLVSLENWMDNQLQSLRESTEGALESLANRMVETFSALDRKYSAWIEHITAPTLTLYAPLSFNGGLPNEILPDVQNGRILNIEISDASGIIFSGLPHSPITITPKEGKITNVKIQYYGTYTGETYEYETTIPVSFNEGYFFDFASKARSIMEEFFGGITVLHLIIISGIVVLILITVIRWRGKR